MLALELIAELDISAASGLVALGRELCVVADDELFLARYDLAGRPLGKIPLFEGALTEEHAARKRAKPDLEALCGLPDGRLLALGSGSTPARERGAVIDVANAYRVELCSLAALYAELRARMPELNIEGAAVFGDAFFLAQRGNGAGSAALIELDLERCMQALARERALPIAALRAIHAVALPPLDGVPLTLTDLAPHPRGLLFTAAAEASANSYDDGPCAGSAIGIVSPAAELLAFELVTPRVKLEGITSTGAVPDSDRLALRVVADPDDRVQRAPLFAVEW